MIKRRSSTKWLAIVEGLALALVLVAALGTAAVGQAAEDFESAYLIDVPFTGEFDISSDEDVDYFSFWLPVSRYGMMVTLDIDADSLGSGLDSYMAIYDAEGDEIGSDDDTDGSDPALSGPLADGVYYIAVQGYSGSTGTYTLHVDAAPIDPEVIRLPHAGTADISHEGETDIFAFEAAEAPHGLTVAIDIDAESTGSDLDSVVYLYDARWEGIEYSDDADGADPYLTAQVAGGTYYVVVAAYDESIGPYTLNVDATPIDPDVVRLPYAGMSDIAYEGETDIYAFEVDETPYGLTVVVDIDAESTGSDLDSIVYLYDDKWQGIGYDDDTDGADPYLRAHVIGGTYYIVVAGYDESIGPYALNVDTSSIEARCIGLPYSGQSAIEPEEERVLYRVELLDDGTLVIDIDAEATGSDLDSYVYLYDEKWTEVASDDDTDGSDSYIEAAVEAGIYYIEVTGYGDSTGVYTLTVESL